MILPMCRMSSLYPVDLFFVELISALPKIIDSPILVGSFPFVMPDFVLFPSGYDGISPQYCCGENFSV